MGIIVFAAIGFILVLSVVGVVKNLVHICQPNEVLIFSGTRGKRQQAYRLVQGGRGLRKPLVEHVHRLDVTNMIIDLRVDGAYSKGGIPLNVAGVANVKVASQEPVIGNAIERFLGKSRGQIQQTAKETLEGNLRGVLAKMTPEEVNEDRVKFAEHLQQEADDDLRRLGLVLDNLKIQNIADDRGYLDSIGRRQSATLQMESRKAEADNQALAAERSAHNFEEKEIARVTAEISLAKADAERRIVDAQTKKTAMVAEQRGEVVALIAKTQGELDVQRARVEQVRLQLLADRVKKAEAQRNAMADLARAQAATIIEEGKATATALREVAKAWDAAGAEAPRIVVAQKLATLVEQVMDTVSDRPIERMTIINRDLANGNNLATRALVTNEQLKETLGVDVPTLLNKLASSPAAPKTSGQTIDAEIVQ